MENAKLKIKQHINRHERIISYIYVFIMFGILVGFFNYYLLKQNKDLNVFSQKIITVKKMKRIKDYQSIQIKTEPLCDSLYTRINAFNPDIQAGYEESDIQFLLNDLRSIYIQNSWDKRFKVFAHVANFYDDWLIDKKELWSKKQNIITFKTNLEECEIGINKKNESIKSKFGKK